MSRKKRFVVRVNRKGIFYLKLLSFIFISIFIFTLLFYFYFYFHFSILVDRAILKKKLRGIPEIFSSPSIIFTGEKLDLKSLEEILIKRGYRFSESLRFPDSFYSNELKNLIYIENSKVWDRRYPSKLAKITFENGWVKEIFDMRFKRHVRRFYISPQVLTFSKGTYKYKYIKYNQIPQNLIYAILSAEDRRFFDHSGIDYFGIFRAMVKNILAGRIVQGGSTLTQQIVKNLFLSPERSFRRKLKEAFIANILEERFSKQRLFEFYVNFVYLGQVSGFEVHGFREAAFVYFGKDLLSLKTSEFALLAGMVKSPIKFSPLFNPVNSMRRRNEVLSLMFKNGFISKREYLLGISKKLKVIDRREEYQSPYFADYVSSVIGNSYGNKVIYSSLNPEVQRALEYGIKSGYREVLKNLKGIGKYEKPEVAAIVVNGKNGNILAMVGGLNYLKSQYNRTIYMRRQAGSIIKPFVYLSLINRGISPHLKVDDSPVAFRYGRRRYIPHNYRNIYYGILDMKGALSKSDNVATVKFAKMAGFDVVAKFINSLGFKEKAVPFPSVALGTIDVSPFEIARAYTIFLNGGVELNLSCLYGKRDVFGRISSKKNVDLILDMLREVVRSGTGRKLKPLLNRFDIAGKTGTAKDGWFVGICCNMITVVWVGYDKNVELGLSGGRSALLIFREFLLKLKDLYPVLKS